MKEIKVPTGSIYCTEQDSNTEPLEFLSIADYGKDQNIKADFLGITRELNGVPNGTPMPLSEKWVITISTQHGCSMGCRFCDVPRVGPGINVSFDRLREQVIYAIERHPEVKHTKRLNIHYARMGEPTFNWDVLLHANTALRDDVKERMCADTIHPVVSTMLPAKNESLEGFLTYWCWIKNRAYNGEAGLQFSINSTSDDQRKWMFNGNSLPLHDISRIADKLPPPVGRKYALNFALTDDAQIDANVLASLFDTGKFMCKITPMHRTGNATDNGIRTTGGYSSFVPYKDTEEAMKAACFDVIVFVPSEDEEDGLITCGNAVLANRRKVKEAKEGGKE